MKYCMVVFATLFAACSDDGMPATPDAAPRPDAPPSCPLPATPLPAGMHELFVSFEGVTLLLGDCDDARTNCSALVTQASTSVPAFLPGQGNRQARITAIAATVQEALAPFSVNVVTTRPASGDYWMVSVGGASDAVVGMADVLIAVKPVCDAMNRNSIALVFEQDIEYTDRAYADTIAGAFGRLVGLVPITQSGDCMCTQATCVHTQTCTWGTGAIPQVGNTCMRSVQNEQGLLMAAVGCR